MECKIQGEQCLAHQMNTLNPGICPYNDQMRFEQQTLQDQREQGYQPSYFPFTETVPELSGSLHEYLDKPCRSPKKPRPLIRCDTAENNTIQNVNTNYGCAEDVKADNASQFECPDYEDFTNRFSCSSPESSPKSRRKSLNSTPTSPLSSPDECRRVAMTQKARSPCLPQTPVKRPQTPVKRPPTPYAKPKNICTPPAPQKWDPTNFNRKLEQYYEEYEEPKRLQRLNEERLKQERCEEQRRKDYLYAKEKFQGRCAQQQREQEQQQRSSFDRRLQQFYDNQEIGPMERQRQEQKCQQREMEVAARSQNLNPSNCISNLEHIQMQKRQKEEELKRRQSFNRRLQGMESEISLTNIMKKRQEEQCQQQQRQMREQELNKPLNSYATQSAYCAKQEIERKAQEQNKNFNEKLKAFYEMQDRPLQMKRQIDEARRCRAMEEKRRKERAEREEQTACAEREYDMFDIPQRQRRICPIKEYENKMIEQFRSDMEYLKQPQNIPQQQIVPMTKQCKKSTDVDEEYEALLDMGVQLEKQEYNTAYRRQMRLEQNGADCIDSLEDDEINYYDQDEDLSESSDLDLSDMDWLDCSDDDTLVFEGEGVPAPHYEMDPEDRDYITWLNMADEILACQQKQQMQEQMSMPRNYDMDFDNMENINDISLDLVDDNDCDSMENINDITLDLVDDNDCDNMENINDVSLDLVDDNDFDNDDTLESTLTECSQYYNR